MTFHPDQNLPDCMMPDGGECCTGHAAVCEDWHKQRRMIEAVVKALNDAAPGIESLACHQVQCDEEGVMIQVSRQALHETLEAVNTIACTLSPPTSPVMGRMR